MKYDVKVVPNDWKDDIFKCLQGDKSYQHLKIKIDENEKVFFTSDTHFGSERAYELSRRNRIFSSVRKMDSLTAYDADLTLQNNENTVYIHLGDRGDWKIHNLKTIFHECRYPGVNREADRSYLVLGNYEKKDMEEQGLTFDEYRAKLIETEGWTDVFETAAVLDCQNTINDSSGQSFHPGIVLTHDPYDFVQLEDYVLDKYHYGFSDKNDRFVYALFGHIHGRQMIKEFGIDVGVDAQHFKMITLEDCMFYLNAISQGFYDQSVFC